MLGKPLFSEFAPLSPQKEMARNSICWCNSGTKWKNCHRDRQLKKRLPDAALMTEFHRQMKLKVCMHPTQPDECKHGTIRSHTIQRSTALKSIAEDDHVLSGRNYAPGKENSALQLVGINSASTFRGFCSYHDQSTFRDADLATEISDWISFLLGYRALAYELYMKIVSIPTLEMFRDNLDAGFEFDEQARCQQFINGQLYTSKLGRVLINRIPKAVGF